MEISKKRKILATRYISFELKNSSHRMDKIYLEEALFDHVWEIGGNIYCVFSEYNYQLMITETFFNRVHNMIGLSEEETRELFCEYMNKHYPFVTAMDTQVLWTADEIYF